MSRIRWEGTEDTVENACPAMMTRWLSHHCAAGLPLLFPCWCSPSGYHRGKKGAVEVGGGGPGG